MPIVAGPDFEFALVAFRKRAKPENGGGVGGGGREAPAAFRMRFRGRIVCTHLWLQGRELARRYKRTAPC